LDGQRISARKRLLVDDLAFKTEEFPSFGWGTTLAVEHDTMFEAQQKIATAVSAEEQAQYEDRSRDFEQAWHTAGKPVLEEFLPAEGPLRVDFAARN